MNEVLTKLQNEMNGYKADIEKLIPEWNKAVVNGDFNTSTEIGTEMDNLEGKYVANAKMFAFETIKENAGTNDELFLESVKMLRFETIRVKESKTGQNKIPERSLTETTKPIDPLEFQKYAKVNIGKVDDWQYMIERLNFLLTVRVAIDIGMPQYAIKKINDSYAMNKITAAMEKGETPTSNTQLMKAMQEVINACLGKGYKVTSHDVKFLLHAYAKKDNKAGLTITASTHKQLRMIFMDVMNNLVEYVDAKDEDGKKVSGYKVSYKAKKEDTPSDNTGFIPIPQKEEKAENPEETSGKSNETPENPEETPGNSDETENA